MAEAAFPFNPILPKGFVVAKPVAQENYSEGEIYRLEREGKLLITRKWDGHKIILVRSLKGEVQIYSSGLHPIDSRLDHIKAEFARLSPPGTVATGEAIVIDTDTADTEDRQRVASVLGQKSFSGLADVKVKLFGLLFHDSKDLTGYPYVEIMSRLRDRTEDSPLIRHVDVITGKFDVAKQLALLSGWEGLVLYDDNYRQSFRLDGKEPKRPKGCYKWKPISEDDFIVRPEDNRLNDSGELKDVLLRQIRDPKTGQEIECGRLGSFNGEMRKKLIKAKKPLVFQVAFVGRYPSGCLKEPRFMHLRTDKRLKECIAPKAFLRK